MRTISTSKCASDCSEYNEELPLHFLSGSQADQCFNISRRVMAQVITCIIEITADISYQLCALTGN